ncbi:hypothetical protein QYS60_13550 [Rhodococcus sp. GXMU-t2271]|uniref:Uncharacterized protein n=1 Tax=Rhodococcus indonesiensis TaxID=3055869 RepID=A0ABT7RJX7_9NOCA|nr:hypothetical protein [Rhodococcus indonesiensis]MDM7487917.1 hypothetical protein [Rhodococcus indonesiensis]
MSVNEPFMPFKRASGEEIDAADPGQGAPGTDSAPPTTAEDARAVESERGEQNDRHSESPFRTPTPPRDG